MEIRISGIVNDSIVDGRGIRLTVFTQGCPHHCPGCHNPQTHDFAGGRVEDTDVIFDMFKKIRCCAASRFRAVSRSVSQSRF